MAPCCLRRPFIIIRPVGEHTNVCWRPCVCVYMCVSALFWLRGNEARNAHFAVWSLLWHSGCDRLKLWNVDFFYTLKHKRTQTSKAKRLALALKGGFVVHFRHFFATSLIAVTQSSLHRRFCPLRFQAAHTRSLDLLCFKSCANSVCRVCLARRGEKGSLEERYAFTFFLYLFF